ncbi:MULTISPECIES: head decoration protein [Pseudomonas]|uniref:head decoration protein n=1 Tax=Pseudomonas TaxID=286 RepID=UPI000B35708F|nr:MULTISPECIES: head decoration protein [Pseudomonas]PMY62086.1 head decoration protein [Pseudomonas sp. FW305-25]PMY63711.1 head decoration protein [Pseudomonas sp. FW126-L8]PNA76531.1 head decoration protein [Pseudomonas sp. FW305-76]
MATFTQPKDPGDLLLVEVCPGWTKEKATLLGGANYSFGQVLAKVSGKYQVLDLAGTGAAKKSAAVLIDAVDATAGDQSGLVIARGATVDLAELVWPEGITEVQKATALDELNALGIVARTAL